MTHYLKLVLRINVVEKILSFVLLKYDRPKPKPKSNSNRGLLHYLQVPTYAHLSNSEKTVTKPGS